MNPLQRLSPILAHPKTRLLDAEQRFFDGHGRGGAFQGQQLVIPLGYFAQPQVEAALIDWLRGSGALDLAQLEDQWKAAPSWEERVAFYRNLATFFYLLAHPEACRVSRRRSRHAHESLKP